MARVTRAFQIVLCSLEKPRLLDNTEAEVTPAAEQPSNTSGFVVMVSVWRFCKLSFANRTAVVLRLSQRLHRINGNAVEQSGLVASDAFGVFPLPVKTRCVGTLSVVLKPFARHLAAVFVKFGARLSACGFRIPATVLALRLHPDRAAAIWRETINRFDGQAKRTPSPYRLVQPFLKSTIFLVDCSHPYNLTERTA